VAVLVGGASTFARWAGDAALLLTDNSPASIKAGEWDLSDVTLPLTAERWFDSSKEITSTSAEDYLGDFYSDKTNSKTTGNFHSAAAGSLLAMRVSYANGLPIPIVGQNHGSSGYLGAKTETSDGSGKGGSLQLMENPAMAIKDDTLVGYAMVPGDQFTGIYVVDLQSLKVDPANLVGEHLKVTVSGTLTDSSDGAQLVFKDDATWGDVVEANAYTALDNGWGGTGGILSNTPKCYTKATGAGNPKEEAPCKASGDDVWGVQIAVVIDYHYTQVDQMTPVKLEQARRDYCLSRVDFGADGGSTWTSESSDGAYDGKCIVKSESGAAMEISDWDGTTFPFNNSAGTPTSGALAISGLGVTLIQTR
jgi:hypothetical protein